MAPIRKGDGTGLAATGYSQIRKGDGTVLWNAIPDSGIYLDDFNDGTTQSRDDYQTTKYTKEIIDSRFDNPERVEWDSDLTVTDARLQLDAQIDGLLPDVSFWGGDNYWRWEASVNNSSDQIRWALVADAGPGASNRWCLEINDGSLEVVKRDDGSFSTSASINLSDEGLLATNLNIIEVERNDSTDEWTLYANDSTLTTFTDTFQPPANNTWMRGDLTGSGEVDDLVIG